MPELTRVWKEKYKNFIGQKIRWTSSEEVAIGPIKTELKPTKEEFEYKEGEVILSLSGFSPETTHVIFCREDHSSVYAVPPYNRGVFARVIGGRRTLHLLENEDKIISIEPIIERESIVKSATTTDVNTKLEEGNRVFTYVEVHPVPESPKSVEHFLIMTENNKMKVDYESNSFVGFYAFEGIGRGVELIKERKRGSVTLRNRGKGIGRIYIYREDRVSTPSHNLVGYVNKGMELIDIAKKGDYITVVSKPGRISTISMTQKEAEKFLDGYEIKQVRDGVKDDNAIIVKQEPRYTMEILKKGEVRTFGVEPEKIVELEVYDDKAPKSSWYFRRITGLIDNPIGKLKVHFSFPGMNLIMFEGNTKESKGLVPENTPKDCVKAGEIGITNMSRKHVGLIGVRFEDNEEFGPTGEPFSGTNIVGKITKGFNNLEKLKDGDIIYVKERK